MFGNFGLLDLGTPELIIILAIILVLFGGKRLPQLTKSIGQSIKEIKNAASGADELKQEIKNQAIEVKTSLTSEHKPE
jgi:sec-independent protein translocase protein TatA